MSLSEEIIINDL